MTYLFTDSRVNTLNFQKKPLINYKIDNLTLYLIAFSF